MSNKSVFFLIKARIKQLSISLLSLLVNFILISKGIPQYTINVKSVFYFTVLRMLQKQGELICALKASQLRPQQLSREFQKYNQKPEGKPNFELIFRLVDTKIGNHTSKYLA